MVIDMVCKKNVDSTQGIIIIIYFISSCTLETETEPSRVSSKYRCSQCRREHPKHLESMVSAVRKPRHAGRHAPPRSRSRRIPSARIPIRGTSTGEESENNSGLTSKPPKATLSPIPNFIQKQQNLNFPTTIFRKFTRRRGSRNFRNFAHALWTTMAMTVLFACFLFLGIAIFPAALAQDDGKAQRHRCEGPLQDFWKYVRQLDVKFT